MSFYIKRSKISKVAYGLENFMKYIIEQIKNSDFKISEWCKVPWKDSEKSSQLVFLKEYSTETKMFNVGQGIGFTLKRTEKNIFEE